jgi:hypothetical protein
MKTTFEISQDVLGVSDFYNMHSAYEQNVKNTKEDVTKVIEFLNTQELEIVLRRTTFGKEYSEQLIVEDVFKSLVYNCEDISEFPTVKHELKITLDLNKLQVVETLEISETFDKERTIVEGIEFYPSMHCYLDEKYEYPMSEFLVQPKNLYLVISVHAHRSHTIELEIYVR